MTDATRFAGFRTGSTAITLAAELFTELLPSISSEAELRVTLHALFAIGRKRGALRAVRQSELAAARELGDGLAPLGGIRLVPDALAAAVARGSLVECAMEDGDTLYFVNSEGGRRQRERVRNGSLTIGSNPPAVPVERARPSRPVTVYEQEIGMLTPAVSRALGEAEARYPAGWVVEALELAAKNNARSWRYAEAILRRWMTEGRDDEETRRDDRAADPYSHVYRRQ